MSQRVVLATFHDEGDLRGAVRAARAAGAKILDVFSPYAVHGLDEDLGWRPSRLTWACALCGGAGTLFMWWLQMWTSAVDWPVNVGGKPFQSLPAFVPVIFEAMVLCGAFGTVLAFFVVAGLWPGKRRALIRPRVTDDRFTLLIEQSDASFDAEGMERLLRAWHAEAVEQEVLAVGGRGTDAQERGEPPLLGWGNATLAAVFTLLVLTILIVPRNTSRPNIEFMPTMRRSVPWDPQTTTAGVPLTAPLPGRLARDGHLPDFGPGESEAKRAADVLSNPLAADDPAILERGREVYSNFCAACHGVSGVGDGPMVVRGYPPPLMLTAEKSRVTTDGELFHVISFGRNYMPAHRKQLAASDRWSVLLYIRQLQRNAVADAEPPATDMEDPAATPDPQGPMPPESGLEEGVEPPRAGEADGPPSSSPTNATTRAAAPPPHSLVETSSGVHPR